MSCPGQFTAWHCSSGHGDGNRLVTLGKRKPTCFQLSPNQPLDYDGNKSQAQQRPRPGGRRRPAAGCLPPAASWPASVRAARNHSCALLQLGSTLSKPSASQFPLGMEGGLGRVSQSLWGCHKVQQRLSSGVRPQGPAEACSYSYNPCANSHSLSSGEWSLPWGNAHRCGCVRAYELAVLSVGMNALLLPPATYSPFRTQLTWPITENLPGLVLPSFPDLYRLVKAARSGTDQ